MTEEAVPVDLTSDSTCLVIVDMQIEALARHGEGVKPVIESIQRLLHRFREAGGNVIHVESIRTPDHPEFTVFGRPYALLEGTDGVKFVEELRPRSGEVVVRKSTHDCFHGTDMEARLADLNLRPCESKIVVTGIGANNCFYHAVLGFHVRHYFTIVPQDCIHSSQPWGKDFALRQFRSPAYNFNVSVTSSDELHLVEGAAQPDLGHVPH